MNEGPGLLAEEIEALAFQALVDAGAKPNAARSLAKAIMAAEQDGISSHGLAYLPTYCLHLRCGKVNRVAEPECETDGSVVRVDAEGGFAHPAIDLGFEALIPLAQSRHIAALAVTNSYNCGVLGYHTERLASAGLVALGFTNSPASIAPWGGRKAILGTNPWSLAVPGENGEAAIVIDQSASTIAKSEVIKHERDGKPIPLGWALDADGKPTTDASEALRGTMVPAGGYKGVGSALMVEIFAACLTGASPGILASPFSGEAGGPPRTGQFFIAIDPRSTSGGLFRDRLNTVISAFEEADGARLPGERRRRTRKASAGKRIAIDQAVYERISPLIAK